MFNSNVLWILAAFVVYMGVMIAIGAKYMKSTKNSEDYFLEIGRASCRERV